jgi:hypothetical protein
MLDGHGKVTGGRINCNYGQTEWASTIVSGCYSVNNDYTGFMSVTTSGQRVCDGDNGLDLRLGIQSGGKAASFSSDGSSVNYITGYYFPFSGVMNFAGQIER